MSYSIVSLLALIMNSIINREDLRQFKLSSRGAEPERKAAIRYSHFLIIANCYFTVDFLWGILYEHHDNPSLFPLLYSDCVLYYVFMLFTMLTWIRYVVAYLDRRGRRSKILLCAVWSMFTLGFVYLMVNHFYPFIFSFNEEHEFIPKPGRHIAFFLQILLYLMTTIYMFYVARKSLLLEKVRYLAVGFTCLVIDIFLILQIFDSRYPAYAMGLTIGMCVIHSFVVAGEKKEKEIYDHIASGLAEDYEAMYYINIETGEYLEFSTSQEYRSLNVPVEGRDFFRETIDNVDRYVHPDDKEFAKSLYFRETVLKNLQERKSYSYKYRVMVGGQAKYYRFTVMRASDTKHIVLYEKDIDDEITAETMRMENQKKNITFGQIAESLAANYDVIYYVDVENADYISYECHNIYGSLDMKKSGDDFYADVKKDVPLIVHKNDRDTVLDFLEKKRMINALKNRKRISIDYRIMGKGRTHNVRLTIRKTSDGSHFIVGIENIDAEIQKQKQHLKALDAQKELARRDELTSVKNKNAYNEMEKAIQESLDSGENSPSFAIVVCDANNLKQINDTEGHVAGDKYIKECAMLLCDIFDHSPVFRVGGDEFVVFLTDSDYASRVELMASLRERVRDNLASGSGPILASGMAEYDSETDSLVSQVFDRADKEMYDNKQSLKTQDR